MKRILLAVVLGWLLLAAGVPNPVPAIHANGAKASVQVPPLPPAAWPAGTTQEDGRTIDAAAADSQLLLSPSIVARSETYAAAGMTSGYYQRYAQRNGSAGEVLAYWMGTLYPTGMQADAMVTLGKAAIAHHATPAVSVACPAPAPADCAVFITTSTNNSVRVGYALWSTENLLAEVAIVAYAGSSAFPAEVFSADLTTLVQVALGVAEGTVHPVATATKTLVPTHTPQPAPATDVPTATASAIPTVGITQTPAPTAATTTVPLFVSVRLRFRSVAAGARQTVRVVTVPDAVLAFAVAFPNGTFRRHRATAGHKGTAAWTFRQPPGVTVASNRLVRVEVTARDGTGHSVVARTHYLVR